MYFVKLKEIELALEAGESCFSPRGADAGTLAMLDLADVQPGEKVLDLGCGCGIVGIFAAKISENPENVYMTDIDEESVRYALLNAEANGVSAVHITCGNAYEAVDTSGFDVILSNPPYHTDFSVAKAFIEKGFNRLKLGGRLIMVTKRREWYENKLRAVFGGVRVHEKNGYFIFIAIRKNVQRADVTKKQQKLNNRSALKRDLKGNK